MRVERKGRNLVLLLACKLGDRRLLKISVPADLETVYSYAFLFHGGLRLFVIVAQLITRFEDKTCEDTGTPVDIVPSPDLNAYAATKSKALVILRYRPRETKV